MATPRPGYRSRARRRTTLRGAGEALSPIAQARVRDSAMRNNAAAELFEDGRHDEAVPLFEQALASCRSALGGDHPDTLIVAGNLAVAYLAAGSRRKGMKLITGNLAARVRVFGDEHPETLTARNALAVAHRIVGDADAAVELAKQVAVQRSRTLGPVHVDTLTSRMGLALAMAAAGHLTTAHGLVASTMSDAEAALGAATSTPSRSSSAGSRTAFCGGRSDLNRRPPRRASPTPVASSPDNVVAAHAEPCPSPTTSPRTVEETEIQE